MKVLIVGPSDIKSRGGMATVISGIRNSKILNEKYDIDIFPSYIDGNIVTRLIYCVFAYIRFLTIYKKYDLFHLHTASNGSTFRKILYLKTVKRAGKKAIVHIHGAYYLVFFDRQKEKRKRQIIDFLDSADLVVALSDDWKEKFEKKFGITNCVSLPNGIDTNAFADAFCNLELHRNEFVLLGRLGERKGVYDLVDAVEKAVKMNPNIKVYMAGDGEIDKVRSRVNEKGLQKNIEVTGWVDLKGKMDLLRKSSTVILPSYFEGLPMSVLEGMAAGKAIISTGVGAIPEVIGAENGILIHPGDIDALADALVKYSTDSEFLKYTAENNKKKAESRFSIECMHRTLAEYYRDLLQKECFFVTPNLANGGAERVTALLANQLRKENIKTSVVYMKDRQTVYPLQKDVPVYFFGEPGNQVERIAKKIFRLRKLMKKHPDAVYIAMLPYETIYTYIASLGLPCRVINSVRNDPSSMRKKIDVLIKKFVYPRADRIVFQTEEARNYFPDKVRKKGVVIPNPISGCLPERFEGERKREIVTVGRMAEQKNYPLLLNAYAEIHRKYPDWKLKIFGEGELKEEIYRLCKRLEIVDAVEFCGFVENPAEQIRKSGMFVLSSDYEGISNAMLEAMAIGLPCICTDCPAGGARMMIRDHENGILVPVRNEKRLAEAMEELIGNIDLAEKISIRATDIKEKLSAEKIAEEWGRYL